ncbi:IS701 family transposase [Streptosporangium sp. H16]|uniref:IS701 family transposase n=1 Tax=Streptosporangium sp. H16 TaxID=3444184 RepID=UPI003F7B1AC2
MVEQLGDTDGVLIVDETGFLKKGERSAGVQRQYSGTAGRIENCQIGVFVAYASPRGRALIDRELYLPKSWATDPERRTRAAIPQEVAFATKPAIARAMLERTLAAGVPARWITADEAYGGDYKFRTFCERHGMGYVVAVPRSQSVGLGPGGDLHADTLVADAPAEAWKRVSAGDGAKGPRVYDWALATLPWEAEPGFGRWLLVRRSIAQPDVLAFYFAAVSSGSASITPCRAAELGVRPVVRDRGCPLATLVNGSLMARRSACGLVLPVHHPHPAHLIISSVLVCRREGRIWVGCPAGALDSLWVCVIQKRDPCLMYNVRVMTRG